MTANAAIAQDVVTDPPVDYRTHPSRYRHWRLSVDGAVATLHLAVDEAGGLRPGYTLKLNSYDLGVDIELADALQRLRFEHPTVKSVIVTSARERIFCSGANIFMLGLSSHAWKVNFCKFTNETRNGIEDASRHSGLKFIAGCNGTTAGGGYEMALACDEIWLVDDRSSAVSLPEVPLLGVLPGTGGLTRVTDKRRVRRDHADIFCTTTEGVRGQRAKEWRLIDGLAKPAQFAETVKARAIALGQGSHRPDAAPGVVLTEIARDATAHGISYRYVKIAYDRAQRRATIALELPDAAPAGEIDAILAQGAAWWPLALVRELDDAILYLRTNEPELGTWIITTKGDPSIMIAADAVMARHADHWLMREVIGLWRRTLARLEVSSRSIITLIEPGSAFAGTLAELAFAADRAYMLAPGEGTAPSLALTEMNFGPYPTVQDKPRLAARFYDEAAPMAAAIAAVGRALTPQEAYDLGLVTAIPDDLDWADEIRIVLEERASLSPDAMTGLEASLRFGPGETMVTRIFGRLSAWQNWIFQRPNAVGETGAMKVFGTGRKVKFDWKRV